MTTSASGRPETDGKAMAPHSVLRNAADGVLAIQPVFAVPVYFSVLFNSPLLWLSLVIAIAPLGIRFWLTRRLIPRTPFDIPILIFILGMLVGLLVASNKAVAIGALGSTLASILIYYGLVSNSNRGNRYWLWVGGVICLITLVLGIWFFSEGSQRIVSFNSWFFKLFRRAPQDRRSGASVQQPRRAAGCGYTGIVWCGSLQ